MGTPKKTYLEIVLLAALTFLPSMSFAHPHILDVGANVEISPETLVDELKKVQVVFIGELHDHEGHHQAQLSMIEALDDEQHPLAIGLEMFRRDSQVDLDVWTDNNMSLEEFRSVYDDNWSLWPVYRPIFLHAREARLKMVGLNIPRDITRKVASSGFQSLSAEQRNFLGNVQCEVDQEYEHFIRRAMGGHGGHGQTFLFFCEAQLIWDTAMARNMIDFLRQNPDYRMIVLAGSGHAWKPGIPRQLVEQSDISYKVILPEIIGRSDRNTITVKSADYLWLDEGDDSWHFDPRH